MSIIKFFEIKFIKFTKTAELTVTTPLVLNTSSRSKGVRVE